jgi:hypothetical protein
MTNAGAPKKMTKGKVQAGAPCGWMVSRSGYMMNANAPKNMINGIMQA